MNEQDWLAEQFEAHRPRLRGVAYRMLGSLSDADDALQDAWLRVSRAGADDVENLAGWLTTIVGRVSLNRLRARRTRREVPLPVGLPEPIVTSDDGADPADEVVLADSIGLALLVVLDTLAPAERVAFVLHDMFGVPYAEIGRIVDRSPVTARQLASRARRRVRGVALPDTDRRSQRQLVDSFVAAVRAGDFERLIAVLAPDVVLRADYGPARPTASTEVRGAEIVARQALTFSRLAGAARRVLVNGEAGLVVVPGRRPFAVIAFTVSHGRIAEIDILADPERVGRLDLLGLTSPDHPS